MSNETSSQTQPKSTTLAEESSDRAKPRPEAAKWRVGNLLQAFAPKKKTTSEQPSAIQEGSVRPVIGPDKAALFLDSAGKIVSAQPRCADFFGREPEELSDLNIKDLLKQGFDQEITNVLAKGEEANEASFHVLALRKDGSEFATQLAFKFLPDNFGFCWTVFVQAPPGYTEKSLNGQIGSRPASQLKATVATTETATQGETPQSGSGEKPPGRARSSAQSDPARVEGTRLARIKFEADKRLRQIQKDYGNRLIQLEQDLAAERQLNENLSKKLESPEKPPDEPQAKSKMSELAVKVEQASSELRTLRTRLDESEASRKQLTSDLDKEREANKLSRKNEGELSAEIQKLQQGEARESARSRTAAQSAGAQSEQRVKELEQQLKDAKTEAEKHNSTRQRLETENRNLTEANAKVKADLDKERDANKKLQGTAEQAEARIRESAGLSKDWEKKVTEFQKNFDELTRNHAAEKNVSVQSVQRVKELEQQLKETKASLAAARTEIEKENSTRQRLESESRNATEATEKTRADLDKERDANKRSRKKEDELNTQIQKLQQAAEEAEERVRESEAQSRDWEKKAAELKKNVDELTRGRADEKSAGAQRVKELEQQLKDASAGLASGKTEAEKLIWVRQRLEAENRNLTDASARTKVDLDEEREANKLSRKKADELNAQVQKLQKAAEQAEAQVRESAAQSQDWEKKAAELKKNVDELTRSHKTEKSAAAQSAQRVKELEQQLKRAEEDAAAGKVEVEKQQAARKRVEAMNRELFDSNTKAVANAAEWTEKQAALEKKASEAEQRARQSVFSLAKANAEAESHRVERERAEKDAASAVAQLEKFKEKLMRQVESEQATQNKIAELEKTIQDRGDDLARAAAALRKESKERQVAQKQSRLVSDMGTRLETNLASLEDAKKTFEISLNQKDEQLQTIERSLAATTSSLDKELAERRRLEGLLTETKQQLEKVSAESKVEISRLQAALDLGELQRKRLEVDLLRSQDGVEHPEPKKGAK